MVVPGLDILDALAEERGAVGAVAQGVREALDRQKELAGVERVGVLKDRHGGGGDW